MMTAPKLLESSLDKLAAKLSELEADHSSELQSVRDVLARVGASSLEKKEFTRNLKDLAQAVIDVRIKSNVGSPLRQLPVPPYDLWLPFKADDLADSDSHDLDDAVRIFKEFNEKVSEELFRSVIGTSPHDPNRGDH